MLCNSFCMGLLKWFYKNRSRCQILRVSVGRQLQKILCLSTTPIHLLTNKMAMTKLYSWHFFIYKLTIYTLEIKKKIQNIFVCFLKSYMTFTYENVHNIFNNLQMLQLHKNIISLRKVWIYIYTSTLALNLIFIRRTSALYSELHSKLATDLYSELPFKTSYQFVHWIAF